MISIIPSILSAVLMGALSVQAQSVKIDTPAGVQSCAPYTFRWSVTPIDSAGVNTTNIGIWVSNDGVPQPIGTSPPPLTLNITTSPIILGTQSFEWSVAALPPNETFVLYLSTIAGSGGVPVSVHSDPFGVLNSGNTGCVGTVVTASGSVTTTLSPTPTPTPIVTSSGSSIFTITPTPSPTTSRSAALARAALSKGAIAGGIIVGGLVLLAMP